MSRDAEIAEFLAAAGWAGAERAPLAGDASARRYERLRSGGARAILMDVPPTSGLVVAPFLAVDRWLRAAGLSAPEVLAADEGRGLVLLEDLGDALFARICATRPEREAGLYAAAADFVYAGAGIIDPAAVAEFPGEVFSLNPVWDRLGAEGTLRGVVYPGGWVDVGRPEGIALAEEELAR